MWKISKNVYLSVSFLLKHDKDCGDTSPRYCGIPRVPKNSQFMKPIFVIFVFIPFTLTLENLNQYVSICLQRKSPTSGFHLPLLLPQLFHSFCSGCPLFISYGVGFSLKCFQFKFYLCFSGSSFLLYL